MSTDVTTTVARVLAEHTLSWEGGHFECSCGWRDLTAGPFFDHQASEVAEALAETAPEGDDREALARTIYGDGPNGDTRWLWTTDGSPNVYSYDAADAVLAAGFRRHPEGTTVTEWRLRCEHGVSGEHKHRRHVPDPGPNCADAVVERRERTVIDVASEWVEVTDG